MSPVSRIEHTRCERVGDTARVCDALPAFPPPARQPRRLQPPCPGPQAPVPRLEHCTASCGFEDPRVLGTCPQGSDLAGPGWPHAVCVVEAPSDCCAARLRGALHQAPSSLRGLRVAQNAVFIPLVMGQACGARLPKRQVCRLRERPRLGGAREGSEATPAWRRKGRWLSLAAGGTAEPWAPPGPPRTPSLPGPLPRPPRALSPRPVFGPQR